MMENISIAAGDASHVPRILIAGASVRAAWQSAVRGSNATHGPVIEVADLFGDADLQAARIWSLTPGYDNLVEVIEASRPDAWIYTGALENRPDLIAAASRLSPLWGCSSECIASVREPSELERVLHEAECQYAPWQATHVGLPVDGSWLRKRRASAAGLGVIAWRGDEIGNVNDDRWYFQERIQGEVCGAVFVACDGQAWLWGVTQQWQGPRYGAPRPFQYVGSLGPRMLDPGEYESWSRIGRALCENFALQGIFGVDALVTRDAVVVIEVNPRWTASVEVLERATGINAMRLHWLACERRQLPSVQGRLVQGSRSNAVGAKRTLVGKAIVYARRPVVAGRPMIDWLASMNSSGGANWPTVADWPHLETTFDSGDPIVSVFVTEDAEDAGAWQKLEHRLQAFVQATHDVIESNSSTTSP